MSSDIEISIAELTNKAYRFLSNREHSARELATKLCRFGAEPAVNQVIRELQERGEQSDCRFAEMFCRSRVNAGKGPLRILRELEEHGISETIINQTMAQYVGTWQQLANQVREKKFGTESPSSYKEWCRQARFLQQRGFSAEHIGSFAE